MHIASSCPSCPRDLSVSTASLHMTADANHVRVLRVELRAVRVENWTNCLNVVQSVHSQQLPSHRVPGITISRYLICSNHLVVGTTYAVAMWLNLPCAAIIEDTEGGSVSYCLTDQLVHQQSVASVTSMTPQLYTGPQRVSHHLAAQFNKPTTVEKAGPCT